MSWISRLLYQSLVVCAPLARSPLAEAVWDRAWAGAASRLSGTVRMPIHGRRVVVNAGYAYPAFARRWPTYNDPLVELVHQAQLAKSAPVQLVDVGAAVGDTVLLVLERCPGAVERFDCVEGDPEFYGFLRANLAETSEAHLHYAMLSDSVGFERELVRTHRGTASAQGGASRPSTTLDSVLDAAGGPDVDVLKIDTDGFDGKVLAGASRLLHDHRPAVIFEWHPLLYDATGQDRHRPFEVLSAAGYRWLLWFNKYGAFSHVDDGYRPGPVDVLADLCVSGRGPGPDWHYDVVALPDGSSIEPAEMAALAYARSRRIRGSPASAPETPGPTRRSRGRP